MSIFEKFGVDKKDDPPKEGGPDTAMAEQFDAFRKEAAQKLQSEMEERGLSVKKHGSVEEVIDKDGKLVFGPFHEMYIAGDVVVANLGAGTYVFNSKTLEAVIPEDLDPRYDTNRTLMDLERKKIQSKIQKITEAREALGETVSLDQEQQSKIESALKSLESDLHYGDTEALERYRSHGRHYHFASKTHPGIVQVGAGTLSVDDTGRPYGAPFPGGISDGRIKEEDISDGSRQLVRRKLTVMLANGEKRIYEVRIERHDEVAGKPPREKRID